MSLDLKHRDSDYFNETDYFICDNGLNGLLVTKLEFSRGFWWTVESLKFKASCLKMQNANEILHMRVKLKGVDYYGSVWKFLSPVKGEFCGSLGIGWDGGLQVKKNGLASFWTNTHDIDFDYEFK